MSKLVQIGSNLSKVVYIGHICPNWQELVYTLLPCLKWFKFLSIFHFFCSRHAEIVDQIRLPGMCVCFGWDKDGDLLAAITGMNCLEIVQNLFRLV